MNISTLDAICAAIHSGDFVGLSGSELDNTPFDFWADILAENMSGEKYKARDLAGTVLTEIQNHGFKQGVMFATKFLTEANNPIIPTRNECKKLYNTAKL